MKLRIAFVNDIPKIMEVAEATWKQTYASIISQEPFGANHAGLYV